MARPALQTIRTHNARKNGALVRYHPKEQLRNRAQHVEDKAAPMSESSFVKSLFQGEIVEGDIFPYPRMSEAETDAVHALLGTVTRFFARHVDSAAIDKNAQIPPEVLSGLAELGLFGLTVPTEYGGAGLSQTAYARIMQEIAGLDTSVAVTVGTHQSLGLRGLMLFGTEAQKRKYLPRAAKGELICAFALTEPGTGSDAAAIQTRAELRDDHYVLNGSKIWISNGAIADLFTVFARTSPPVNGAKPRITAFLVERDFGVKTGPNEAKLGIRGNTTTEVSFDEVCVPPENVLFEVGRGFKVAVEVLNDGRLSLATGCLGIAKKLISLSAERAGQRRAFGRSIGEFGLIKDKVAEMMSETYALECMTYLTTGLVDRHVHDYAVESAICKVFGSEALWRIVNDSLQIAAGTGYMAAYPYERLLRDARVNLIFEGTSEILRCFIALSGMQGPGRELSDVSRALREPIKGFGLLSEFALRKAKVALGRERLSRAHPLLNREVVVLEQYVQDLTKNVDKVLRRHGKNIAEMQYTQKRVADMAIDLFAIASVISRTTRAIEARGEEGARRELDLAHIFVRSAETRLARTVHEFDRNDDELRKSVATKSYGDGGYPLDII